MPNYELKVTSNREIPGFTFQIFPSKFQVTVIKLSIPVNYELPDNITSGITLEQEPIIRNIGNSGDKNKEALFYGEAIKVVTERLQRCVVCLCSTYRRYQLRKLRSCKGCRDCKRKKAVPCSPYQLAYIGGTFGNCR